MSLGKNLLRYGLQPFSDFFADSLHGAAASTLLVGFINIVLKINAGYFRVNRLATWFSLFMLTYRDYFTNIGIRCLLLDAVALGFSKQYGLFLRALFG
nr:hypothetical protein [Salinispira pacifica]